MTEYIETEWIDSQIESFERSWCAPQIVVGGHQVTIEADWDLPSMNAHCLAIAWWQESEE